MNAAQLFGREMRGKQAASEREGPHDVDAEVGAQLGEEAEHLPEVCGVAVGVEQREARGGVAPEGGDDARAGPGGQRVHVDGRVGEQPRHPQRAALARGRQHLVRRRLRREEGQLRRHRRRHVPHPRLRRRLFLAA